MEKGIEQGIEQGKLEVARQMIAERLEPQLIAKVTACRWRKSTGCGNSIRLQVIAVPLAVLFHPRGPI